MVTSVPPDSGPRLGVRKLTAGVCGKTRRRSAVLLPAHGEQKKTLFKAEQQNGDVSRMPEKTSC